MRLEPARATRLFGDHTSALEQGVKEVRLGATKKYVLVGNMMAPVMAQLMARLTEGRSVDSLLPDGAMFSTGTLF